MKKKEINFCLRCEKKEVRTKRSYCLRCRGIRALSKRLHSTKIFTLPWYPVGKRFKIVPQIYKEELRC